MKWLLILSAVALTISAHAEIKVINRQGEKIDFSKYHFVDDNGSKITLSQYFKAKKPVFLAPVYYDCPGVCTLTLNRLFEDLRRLKFNPGKAIEVVVFSINPEENSDLAANKKENYLDKFKYQQHADGFHFLVGQQNEIQSLTNELGFIYEKRKNEFYHPSAIYLLTPEGRISKILNGKTVSTKRLHQYVYNAAHGKKLTGYEKMLLSCKPEEKTAITNQ